MTKFLLLRTIEDSRFKEIDEVNLKKQISGINTAVLKVGLDIHAGFNIPSYDELKEILMNDKNKRVEIFFSLIDERAQSADLPYSPTKIFVKKENNLLRKMVYSHRSIYLSKIPLEREIIIDNYKKILGGNYKQFYLELEESTRNSKTLGEFIFKLNCSVISNKLKDFKNIHLITKFDNFDENKQEFHPITTHSNQQIIYIALHKAMYDEKELKYLENKFKKAFSGENKYIILPINPSPYFSI